VTAANSVEEFERFVLVSLSKTMSVLLIVHNSGSRNRVV
jgi:hypothetical protein